MRRFWRGAFDKLFSGTAGLSIALMAGALVIILGPMLWRGGGAVLFTGTVEFRQSQLYESYAQRGDPEEIERQIAETNAARQPLYDLLHEFGRAIDVYALVDEIKDYQRHVLRERYRNMERSGAITPEQEEVLTDTAEDLRRALVHAYEAETYEQAEGELEKVLAWPEEGNLPGEAGPQLTQARQRYREAVAEMKDRARRYGRVLDRLVRISPEERAEAGFGEAAEEIDALRAASRGRLGDQPEKLRGWEALADKLKSALDADATYKARPLVDEVLDSPLAGELDPNSPPGRLFAVARDYRGFLAESGLAKRSAYGEELDELKDALEELFGPAPGDAPKSALAESRYGATRWDEVIRYRRDVLYTTDRVLDPEKNILRPVVIPRSRKFDGKLDEFFAILSDDERVEAMFLPEFTFYWQYFIDNCTPGHQFGGVGPEVAGTVAVTLMTMLFAVPLGIISAAYLVECTDKDNLFIRILRTCINTLAGVPSIVFGLWGLAFVVLSLQPALGLESKPSILAGAITLAALVLPIVIRASEEAIRTVPQSYKEASLSLGAGGFRTFVTVTLPAALPGVLTGIILSMSRAAGETAPLLFTAAAATMLDYFPESVFSGEARILSYSSYDITSGDDTAMDYPHKQYGIIMTLIVIVLMLNIAAILLRSRVSKKLQGR